MPSNSTVQTPLIEVSEDFALYLSSNEELPPTLCPDLIPVGWELFRNDADEPEVLDPQLINGEYLEVYLLRRTEST